jgi:transposase
LAKWLSTEAEVTEVKHDYSKDHRPDLKQVMLSLVKGMLALKQSNHGEADAEQAVMTLCLLVYNDGQYRLKSALEDQGETIPNQINKPVQNPTVKWIVQIMAGIGIIKLY